MIRYKQQIRKPAVVDKIKGKGNKMGARSCKLLLIGTDSGLITVGLPAYVFWLNIVCLYKLQQIHSPVTNLPLSQDSISEDPFFVLGRYIHWVISFILISLILLLISPLCDPMPIYNQECLHLLLQLINFIFGSEFAEIFLARFSSLGGILLEFSVLWVAVGRRWAVSFDKTNC